MAVSISISVAQNSQSTSNNTSNITAEVTAHWTEGSYNLTGNASGSITIDGTKYDFGQLYFNADHTNAGSQVIMSKTVNVKHNSDGTKNLTVSAAFQSGVSSGQVSTKVVRTLTTIPRTSTPTLSSDSVDMGAKVTITTNRKSSSFTHNLAYSFEGGDYVSFATGVGASYEWTTPDLASLIPNATSGTLVIRCITKNGSSTVGTKTVSMTLKVPETVVPTIPTVSVVETTAGVAAQFGGFVKSKSAVKVTITASGAKGSTIKSYHSTLDGNAYDSASFTTPILMGSGTLNLVVKVTDSRGRIGTKTVPLVMLGYSSPAISALQVYRVNSAGAEDPDGTYIAVRYAYSVQPLNNKNTTSMVLEYKRTIDSSWSRLLTNTALSADTTAKPTSPTFSIDYQYDIRMTVTDWFGSSAIYPATLPSGAVVFDIKADGKGIAFGKTSEFGGVGLGWDLELNGHAVLNRGVAAFAPSGYGLGTGSVTPPNNSLDEAVINGWYVCSPSTTGAPTGHASVNNGVVSVSTRYSAAIQEYWVEPHASIVGYPLKLVRTKNNTGTWTPWEWVDPPMVLGVEYRTTERHTGAAVYTKLINFGYLPNTSGKEVTHSLGASKILRVSATLDSGTALPVENAAGNRISISATTSVVRIVSNYDTSGRTATVQLWYTKP